MPAKYRVVVPTGSEAGYVGIIRAELEKVGAELVEIEASTEERRIEGARDCDAYIARGPVTRRLIESMHRCKIIATPSVGFDNIDVEAATECGIVVNNVPDVFIEEVADHTMMLLLACAKKLSPLDRLLKERGWADARRILPPVVRIYGKTLGFVAFGNIPRATARRAQTFGLRCVAYDPYISEVIMTERGVTPVGLEDVFRLSDFVSVHVPLNKETHHLIREDHFRLMKKSAYFIHTGRGGVVDDQALIKALREGWIAGAGIDVFEQEPTDPDNPLFKMDNVVVTPHTASYSEHRITATPKRTGEEIAAMLTGKWPRSIVNPEVKERLLLRPRAPLSPSD